MGGNLSGQWRQKHQRYFPNTKQKTKIKEVKWPKKQNQTQFKPQQNSIPTLRLRCTRLQSNSVQFSPTTIIPPTHTYSHTLLFILLAHVTKPCSAQSPAIFYFSEHNYLMVGPLVSPSCFCAHDLTVNNLAMGAHGVVHQNSRCSQSEEAGLAVCWISIFWPSTHLHNT